MTAKTPSPYSVFLWLAVLSLAVTVPAAPQEDLDAAFERFWKAKKPLRFRSAIEHITELDPAFDNVHGRLRTGRPYSGDVDTGVLHRTRKYPFHYTVVVPEDYDPARRYPVSFALHGGVARPQWNADGKWWRSYEEALTADRISVFPASWNAAMWWEGNQVENLEGILGELKRSYNIDENRVTMVGISDGGTGAYFFAFRAPTPWASFLPLIGHAAVLTNRGLRVDGQIYVPNLANRPLFVVNAGQDRLYPSARVRPFIELFRRGGAQVEFVDKPEATHGMAWWPEEKVRAKAFIREHPRDPLPERIVWETERTDRYHRFAWLEITQLGEVDGESDLDDVNSLKKLVPNRVFPRDEPSGRVDLERRGNHVDVKTRGVKRFRLLLSPDEFDLASPVSVVVNGRPAFRGMVEPDVETLLRWAAKDQDRTMLFAAELDVEVPGG